MNTTELIRKKLNESLKPTLVDIFDDSAKHASHKDSRKSGGGHYEIVIESELFRGKPLVEQHRMVNEALKAEFAGGVIHALAIRTRVPSAPNGG